MSKTLLLIDDDDDIREIAQLALELGANWNILSAASGEEGIATARAKKPDAILLDVMMPVLDGPATLARLREDEETRAIPVVFLTAKARPAERDGQDDELEQIARPCHLEGVVIAHQIFRDHVGNRKHGRRAGHESGTIAAIRRSWSGARTPGRQMPAPPRSAP